MQQLIDELNRASQAYYNGQPELLTDYEWDARFDELRQLEEATGETLPDSPTQRVSEDNTEGQKEAHEYPALSLAKTKLVGDLAKWAEGRPVWVSWKLDGLTLVATYDDGRLTKVVTRGNGHIGTNITHLAKAIRGIPPRIADKGHTVVRGEAVIAYDDFNRFLIESGEDYANPRNLASGSLSLKDAEEVSRRNIQWIPFTLVHTDTPINSWGERMDWLDSMGFTTVERQRVDAPTIDSLQAAVDAFTLRVTTAQNPFPVDGLVIAYDDTAYAQSGSVTGHHATRGGLAFKWQDESADTILEAIEWSCAANTISPVAIFRPVQLEGTTVKRASLCNISECERLGIGDAGTHLSVIKANKIIPKVIHVSQRVGSLQIPATCPVCHHPTVVTESEVSGTRTLHCTNESCPAKQLRKYARFVSKEGLDIDGISEQTLAKFINQGWISQYADIFRLRSHISQIASLEGFGSRSAANIMRSVDGARKVDARRLLVALSIPKCGPDVAKRLLSAYTIDDLMAGSVGDLSHIDGIGPERSAIILEWFANTNNRLMLSELLQEIQVSQPTEQPSGLRCQGLTIVITGDVHHFKNRSALKSYIESQGGHVAGSVSRATSLLINNDATSASSKNRKAQELGIPIITEDQFVSQYGSAEPQQPTLF